MKKAGFLSLALVMILTLSACSGGSGGGAGYYVIESMTHDGYTLPASDFSLLGGDKMSLWLKEDGTVEMYSPLTGTDYGTWKNGTITTTSGGETKSIRYSISGSKLTLTTEDEKVGIIDMVFTRSQR